MLLTEAKFAGYLRFNGGVMIFAGRGKNVPAFVIYDKTTAGYDVIESRPGVYDKTSMELYKLKNRLDPNSGLEYQALSQLASRLRLGWPKSELDMAVLNKYPKIFTSKTVRDKQTLHQILCVDNQMADGDFTKYFGELEHADNAEEVEDFKGLKIFFPSQMRDSRKKEFHRIFEDLKGIYTKFGLSKVVTGNVKFSSIADGSTLGLYYLNSKEIRVNPAGKDLMRMYYTMIHEFAHKYYYEFIPGKIPEIERKFRELGGIHQDKTKGHVPASFEHNIKMNDILLYNGKDKQYLKFGKKWKVTLYDGKKVELSAVAMPQVKLSATGGNKGFDAFLNSGFAPEQEDTVKVIRIPFAHDLSHRAFSKTSDWFPSSYSMTNASEWFAEMLTMYMLGCLEGDVKKYVESLI